MNLLATTTITPDDVHREAGQVPGVALVVVGPEGVRARASAGWADIRSRVPMTATAAMPWFSMTKIATATLAVTLADQGLVDLDEPVIGRVQEVGLLKPAGWAEQITARHLLNHSAGLANPIPVRWIHPREVAGPDQDAMLTSLLTKHTRLRRNPGTHASYSNLGALIVAAWITRSVGTPFATLMRQKVLDPLAMSTTDFGTSETPTAATGYHPRANPMRFLLPRWVSGPTDGKWLALKPFALDGLAYGGLVGTPDEAARFLQMHLADGAVNGTRIVSEESARAMRRITATGKRFDFGMGWFRPAGQPATGAQFMQHIGGGAGFHSVMRIYPEARVGAVVMGNATAFDTNAVAKIALDFQ